MFNFFKTHDTKDIHKKMSQVELFEQFENTVNSLEEFYVEGGKQIKYEELEAAPLFKHIILGPGVVSWKLPSETEGDLRFMVILHWGGRVLTHKHNCIERVKILQGQVIESIQDQIFQPGDDITFRPNEYHEFTNISKYRNIALMYVVFTKDDTNS